MWCRAYTTRMNKIRTIQIHVKHETRLYTKNRTHLIAKNLILNTLSLLFNLILTVLEWPKGIFWFKGFNQFIATIIFYTINCFAARVYGYFYTIAFCESKSYILVSFKFSTRQQAIRFGVWHNEDLLRACSVYLKTKSQSS